MREVVLRLRGVKIARMSQTVIILCSLRDSTIGIDKLRRLIGHRCLRGVGYGVRAEEVWWIRCR